MFVKSILQSDYNMYLYKIQLTKKINFFSTWRRFKPYYGKKYNTQLTKFKFH